jgi:uncharacterized membrane protein
MEALNKEINKKNIVSGFLFGIGLVAFIDETVFHQILHWHHFYDKATTDIGLVSDGFFHALSWFATVGGLFLLADLKRRKNHIMKTWWGAVLLGGGVFQFYDGTVQHKWMRLHQIRYVENVFIYDFIWNSLALGMILVGAILLIRSSKSIMVLTK